MRKEKRSAAFCVEVKVENMLNAQGNSSLPSRHITAGGISVCALGLRLPASRQNNAPSAISCFYLKHNRKGERRIIVSSVSDRLKEGVIVITEITYVL